MNPFSTVAWRRVHKAFLKSKAAPGSTTNSLERWALRFMHRPRQLEYLATATVRYLASLGQSACVRFESLWIDGTPQAHYATCSHKTGACELGDLLVVVDRFELAGGRLRPLDSRALIVQAKLANRPTRIPAGPSTTKERDLLEGACRIHGLDLYSGTSGGRPLGHYVLPKMCGLDDYATYLLLPKSKQWKKPHPTPFVCAWPVSRSTRATTGLLDYVSTLGRLCTAPRYGHLLTNPSTCDWTKLVYALMGNYRHVIMGGYGNQPRVNTSAVHCAVASASGAGSGVPVAQSDSGHSASGVTSAGLSHAMLQALVARHGLDAAHGHEGGGTDDNVALRYPDDGQEGPGISIVRCEVVIRRDDREG